MPSSTSKINWKNWWRHPVIVAFIILALAGSVGIWAETNHSSKELKHKINTYSTQACIGSLPIYNKFNDLVTSIVSSRQAQLLIDTASGNKFKVAADQLAIKHYQNDFIIGPTKAECRIPVLK